MKIKTTVTEIECNVNELRQNNSLADSFNNWLRGCFDNIVSDCDEDEDAENEDAESEDKE